MHKKLLPLLLFFLFNVGLSQASVTSNSQELVTVFRDIISPMSQFPVQGTSYDNIESTFGPRYQNSIGRAYDWHRGIDFDAPLGTSIFPALEGRLYKTDNTEFGGYQVWIEHDFPYPITFQGVVLQHFYTFYGHMENLNFVAGMNIGDNVNLTTQIGTVGTSGVLGTPPAPHLHFELRVGTNCSLEFQLKYPSSKCSVGYGFDPHVHPMLLFPPGVSNISFNLPGTPLKTQDWVVEWYSNQEQPTMNHIEFELLTCDSLSISTAHTLDLNERIGFDASNLTQLDTQNNSKPYIQPVPFTDSSTVYQMNLVIPSEFVLHKEGLHARLRITDIWGNETLAEWDYQDSSCAPQIVASAPQPDAVDSQASIEIFDPALSKIGVLLPDELGLLGERLQWQIRVRNTSTVTANDVSVSDTLRPELRIDNVSSTLGLVNVNQQTVTVELASLLAGQEILILIDTTVLQSNIAVDNSACVLQNDISLECITSNSIWVSHIEHLPATGESPLWRTLLEKFVLFALALTGLMICFHFRKRLE